MDLLTQQIMAGILILYAITIVGLLGLLYYVISITNE